MYGLPDSAIYGTYKRVAGSYRAVPEDGYEFWAEFLFVMYSKFQEMRERRNIKRARPPRRQSRSRIHLVGRD